MNETELVQKAISYLKNEYDEETIGMTVMKNSVNEGSGILHVECTVCIGKHHSDWKKWFTFKGGSIVSMRWEQKPSRQQH